MKKIVKAREFSSFIFLIALFAIVGIINPAFLSADNIIACFNESVVYIIISAGMAFAIFRRCEPWICCNSSVQYAP